MKSNSAERRKSSPLYVVQQVTPDEYIDVESYCKPISTKVNRMVTSRSLAHGLQKYGVPRSQVSFLSTNTFSMVEAERVLFSEYFLLHWSTEYFLAQMKEGTLSRDGKTYNVVYSGCTPTQVRRASQLAVSFRTPQLEYELPGMALVRVLTTPVTQSR